MTTHIPTSNPVPGLADPLSESSLDRLAAQALAALGAGPSAPVSAARAPLPLNQAGATAITTAAPSPFPGGAGGAPLPAIPAGLGAGRTGAPAIEASAPRPSPGGQGAPLPEISAGSGIGRSGAPALDATAQAQPPGGPGGGLIPAVPTGSEVGAAGLPEFDAGLGHSTAAVTAAAESLAPGFGAPPATEGILPVILPVSANGLSGAPAPAVPAAGAPGLPTTLPNALTPRSLGLPGEDDLQRLLVGLDSRPYRLTDGLPGRAAPQFYFLDPQSV